MTRQVSDHRCECGCGAFTLVADKSGARRSRRGEPNRYLRSHHRGVRRSTDRPCDPGTLVVCAGPCGELIHRTSQHQRCCAAGHRSVNCRRLCEHCWRGAAQDGTLTDYPRMFRTRDELLDDWAHLSVQGVGYREFAGRVGMTFAAWDRAYWRARAAGDERAVRPGQDRRAA